MRASWATGISERRLSWEGMSARLGMALGSEGLGRVSSEGYPRGKEGHGAWAWTVPGTRFGRGRCGKDGVNLGRGTCVVSTQRVTRGTEGISSVSCFEKVFWPPCEENAKGGGGNPISGASQRTGRAAAGGETRGPLQSESGVKARSQVRSSSRGRAGASRTRSGGGRLPAGFVFPLL